MLDAVKEIIEGSLEPEIKEVTVGIAEVKDTLNHQIWFDSWFNCIEGASYKKSSN